MSDVSGRTRRSGRERAQPARRTGARLSDALPISVVAALWSRETGAPVLAVELDLMEAARASFSKERNRGFYLTLLQAKDRDQLECEAESTLLGEWPGLHTRALDDELTRDTPVSRADLSAWCESTGRPRPRFWFAAAATTAKARSDCRRWLLRNVNAGAKDRPKDRYFEEAARLIPGLSRNAFDEIWRQTVPDVWKRPPTRGARSRGPTEQQVHLGPDDRNGDAGS